MTKYLLIILLCITTTAYSYEGEKFTPQQEIDLVNKLRDDYKNDPPRSQLTPEQQNNRNFHYYNLGAVGSAAGMSKLMLLKISDDPTDQEYIRNGIDYAEHYEKNLKK